MKKHLTKQEEFEIMKLVLDKFLWLGIFILGFGFWRMIASPESLGYSFLIVISGAILLIIFMVMIVREYEYMK
jgi:hypothetical protein